jgi:uncharacterized protein (DUF302 family)
MRTDLGVEVHLNVPYEKALERVLAALRKEGFGVITTIQVHDIFKEKLGREFREYSILGACNPQLAYRALSQRAGVGLLLPCNITVERDSARSSIVRIANPNVLVAAAGLDADKSMQDVAAEALARLTRVAESLHSA